MPYKDINKRKRCIKEYYSKHKKEIAEKKRILRYAIKIEDVDIPWERINKTETCWIWTGSQNGKGYGEYAVYYSKFQTHRLLYTKYKGKIPEGLVIDHLCRNTICCNPAHLEAVTSSENTIRGFGITYKNRIKTHCIHGHEFTSNNTYYYRWFDKKRNKLRNAERKCITCMRRCKKQKPQ